MRFSVRDLVYLGLFGAIWGALEVSLGSYLHVLRVPFVGTLMTALGITIALVGRAFVAKRGSVLYIGVVAALLKAFSLGGIVINPMLAIVVESALAEAGLWPSRHPRRSTYVLAGALAVSWDFFHQFFTQGLLAGRGIFTVYEWTLTQGAELLGLDAGAPLLVLALLLALRVSVGAVVGYLAWSLARAVRRRVWDKVEMAEVR